MGAQIIKRTISETPEIVNVNGSRVQISYNSDGHIVVRYYNSQNNDTLIVFDKFTSDIICNFILENIKAPHANTINYNDVPF